MKRIAAIEEAEESSFSKELAELRVRVDQDISRKEDLIPPTSIIAVSKPEAPAPIVEEINYMQGGGSNRNYNNNYRPNQGDGNFNNYNGNQPHPNLSYSKNNFLQPLA